MRLPGRHPGELDAVGLCYGADENDTGVIDRAGVIAFSELRNEVFSPIALMMTL